MERFTISLSDQLIEQLDRLVKERHCQSRSEMVRELMTKALQADEIFTEVPANCAVHLSYLYNRHERRLAQRLAALRHEAYDLVVSSMRFPLDHDHCVENLVLQGLTTEVRNFAEKISAETGVRNSSINVIPLKSNLETKSLDL